jgi:hypothetical protein
MDDKIQKGTSHMVLAVGNEEKRFQVRVQTDKFGTGNEIGKHKVKTGNEVSPKV